MGAAPFLESECWCVCKMWTLITRIISRLKSLISSVKLIPSIADLTACDTATNNWSVYLKSMSRVVSVSLCSGDKTANLH